MLRLSIPVLMVVLVTLFEANAQERSYTLALSSSFTTSSKIFPHPFDPDELVSSEFTPIDNIFGAGIDIRRRIDPLRIQIGLSIEHLTKTELFSVPITSNKVITVNDGFIAVPVEFSGYFPIPFNSEKFEMYMGGGFGIYWGSRRYDYANVTAANVETKIGYGIHVLSGLQYAVTSTVAVRTELKFRNVQFDSVNKFDKSSAVVHGSTIHLDQQPFTSRADIDGMVFSIGLAFRF